MARATALLPMLKAVGPPNLANLPESAICMMSIAIMACTKNPRHGRVDWDVNRVVPITKVG